MAIRNKYFVIPAGAFRRYREHIIQRNISVCTTNVAETHALVKLPSANRKIPAVMQSLTPLTHAEWRALKLTPEWLKPPPQS